MRGIGFPFIEQPPYSPELNPVVRIFEYLRARIEGIVYPNIGAKVAAVDAILAGLDADWERVKSLTHWHWNGDNLAQLPSANAA